MGEFLTGHYLDVVIIIIIGVLYIIVIFISIQCNAFRPPECYANKWTPQSGLDHSPR